VANIKQQRKRVRQDAGKRSQRQSFRKSVRTAIKHVERHIENGDAEQARKALNHANKKLDMAQSKGLHHKNFVARHKSRLQQRFNELR